MKRFYPATMEGVHNDVIANYLDKAGEIEFSKTASRSLVAKLNNTVRETNIMWDYLDESSLIQRYISIATARFIKISADGEGFYPVDEMLECLGLYSEHNKKVKSDDVREPVTSGLKTIRTPKLIWWQCSVWISCVNSMERFFMPFYVS